MHLLWAGERRSAGCDLACASQLAEAAGSGRQEYQSVDAGFYRAWLVLPQIGVFVGRAIGGAAKLQ